MLSWEPIVASLISLVVGTLFGSEISRYLYKPRVFIRYKETSPLHREDGTHWSLTIVNLGRTKAEECIGIIFLDNVSQADLIEETAASSDEVLPDYPSERETLSFPRKQLVGPGVFRPIIGHSVAWARLGNPQRISINPGLMQTLDICKVQKHPDGAYTIFPTEDGWRRVRARIRKSRIVGRIMVCPANEFPTLTNFVLHVEHDGNSSFKVSPPRLVQRVEGVLSKRRYYFRQ